MKKGKIIKSQKELYYVACDGKTFMAKARGNFRVKKIKPLVGDNVIIDDLTDGKAYITDICERKNEIKRPNISNIDQILLFATIKNPPLNIYNLDKYLAMCEYKHMEVVIILSKIDLCDESEIDYFTNIYKKIGYKLVCIDNYGNFPKEEILDLLKDKTSAVSGASGVGKSTFLNNLVDHDVEIGSISEKSKRGKNTTRHTEIFKIADNTFIFDTPGFDSFDIDFIEDERELKYLFKEFRDKACKFKDCNHINEPNCAVKSALEKSLIDEGRYKNYLMLFEEVKKRRENKW